MSTTSEPATRWSDLLNESVHTSDDHDIGDIEALNREFMVVKRGFVNVHYYYIPASKIEGWDGNVLWLKATEDEVKQKYEKDHVPDPSRYLIKDYTSYYGGAYPQLTVIPSRYILPAYVMPAAEAPVVYRCDLCDTAFRDDEELGKHVRAAH